MDIDDLIQVPRRVWRWLRTNPYAFYLKLAGCLAIVYAAWHFQPDLTAVGMWDWWQVQPDYDAWLKVLGIAVGASIVYTLWQQLSFNVELSEDEAKRGPLLSFARVTGKSILRATLVECYSRWLFVLTVMILVAEASRFFGGRIEFMEQMYTGFVGPMANFTSFGYLEEQLLKGSWVLGFAIVTANTEFTAIRALRGQPYNVDGNWFAGFYFFYVLFHFGLPLAIVTHLAVTIAADLTAFGRYALAGFQCWPFVGENPHPPEPEEKDDDEDEDD